MSSVTNQPVSRLGQLGLWDAIGIIVGIVIGTTIYQSPAFVFGHTADQVWGLSVWVIGGLIALIGAFCYAELATTYPKAGGDYYYLSKGFGPMTGFLFGWAQLTVVMPASIGAMAYVFADFFMKEFFADPAHPLEIKLPIGDDGLILDPHFAIAVIVVVALMFTNILGVFVGKTVQNLLTFAKVIGLGALIVCGLCWQEPGAWTLAEVPKGTVALGSVAMIIVMYAYGGWNDSAFVAAEVRDPKRNIPRALFIGIGIIVTVYLLVNAAYINNIGWTNIKKFDPGTDKPFPSQVIADAVNEWGGVGEWGGLGMSIIVMVSALGAVNGLTFTGARVYATLGADHGLFGWMGRWRPGRGAPIMAIILQALFTVFIVAAITTERGHNMINEALGAVNEGVTAVNSVVASIDETREIPPIEVAQAWQSGDGFEKLVNRTAPVFWTFFLLTGLSLFRLRERFKDLPRPYSVPLYPLVPIIFCCSCAWMLYQSTDYVGWHVLFAVAVVLLGLPLYWLSLLTFGVPSEGPLNVGIPVAPSPKPPPWK